MKQGFISLGVGAMTISIVSGWSRQRELHLLWRGRPAAYTIFRRAKFEIVALVKRMDKVVRTVIEFTRTRESEDEVVFVTMIEQVVNIPALHKSYVAILQREIDRNIDGQAALSTITSKSSLERNLV